MTILGNRWIESLLWSYFEEVESDFQNQIGGRQYNSYEPVLTGILFSIMRTLGAKYTPILNALPNPNITLRFNFEDMATLNREKKYGADIAFILNLRIKDEIIRNKILFIQCKKSNRHSWLYDWAQAVNLECTSIESIYLIYVNPKLTIGYSNRITPRQALVSPIAFHSLLPIKIQQANGIMRENSHKTVIPMDITAKASKPFADLMVNDFIGCWLGEEIDPRINSIIEGDSDIRGPRYVVKTYINIGNIDQSDDDRYS